ADVRVLCANGCIEHPNDMLPLRRAGRLDNERVILLKQAAWTCARAALIEKSKQVIEGRRFIGKRSINLQVISLPIDRRNSNAQRFDINLKRICSDGPAAL